MRPILMLRFLKTAGREGLALLFALRDPGTPTLLKAAIAALALYVLSPVDLVPDVLVLFGWADDVALLMFGIPYLYRRLPSDVRARAADRVAQLRGRFGPRRA
jgi:uncharacterized membrane protein YkvA (DUF1232 family)